MNADDVKKALLPLKQQIEEIKSQCNHKHEDGSPALEGRIWNTLFSCAGCDHGILTSEQKDRIERNIL